MLLVTTALLSLKAQLNLIKVCTANTKCVLVCEVMWKGVGVFPFLISLRGTVHPFELFSFWEVRLCLRCSCAYGGSSSLGICVAAVTHEWSSVLSVGLSDCVLIVLHTCNLPSFPNRAPWWTSAWSPCFSPSVHTLPSHFLCLTAMCPRLQPGIWNHCCLIGCWGCHLVW